MDYVTRAELTEHVSDLMWLEGREYRESRSGTINVQKHTIGRVVIRSRVAFCGSRAARMI